MGHERYAANASVTASSKVMQQTNTTAHTVVSSDASASRPLAAFFCFFFFGCRPCGTASSSFDSRLFSFARESFCKTGGTHQTNAFAIGVATLRHDMCGNTSFQTSTTATLRRCGLGVGAAHFHALAHTSVIAHDATQGKQHSHTPCDKLQPCASPARGSVVGTHATHTAWHRYITHGIHTYLFLLLLRCLLVFGHGCATTNDEI